VKNKPDMNKSGISATSNVMLNNSRYTNAGGNNTAYYQDTNASQSNLNPDLEEVDGKIRPITRDMKLRSTANRNNTTSGPTINKQSYPNTQSALSGKDDIQTFQNTINIGSFINEINNQNAALEINSMVNTGTQGSIEQTKVTQQL
jgi:hypothetical protein